MKNQKTNKASKSSIPKYKRYKGLSLTTRGHSKNNEQRRQALSVIAQFKKIELNVQLYGILDQHSTGTVYLTVLNKATDESTTIRFSKVEKTSVHHANRHDVNIVNGYIDGNIMRRFYAEDIADEAIGDVGAWIMGTDEEEYKYRTAEASKAKKRAEIEEAARIDEIKKDTERRLKRYKFLKKVATTNIISKDYSIKRQLRGVFGKFMIVFPREYHSSGLITTDYLFEDNPSSVQKEKVFNSIKDKAMKYYKNDIGVLRSRGIKV